MRPEWRAPACYLGVALICALYLWITPGFVIPDVMAGAGLGAAAMWALNDWEQRHPVLDDDDDDVQEVPLPAPPTRIKERRLTAHQRNVEEALANAPVDRWREPRAPSEGKTAIRRPTEPTIAPEQAVRRKERPVVTPQTRDEKAERIPAPERIERSERTGSSRNSEGQAPGDTSKARQAVPSETPIEAWRREVKERELARTEAKLRKLADTPSTPDSQRRQDPPRPQMGDRLHVERPPSERQPADRESTDRWPRQTRIGSGRSFPRG